MRINVSGHSEMHTSAIFLEEHKPGASDGATSHDRAKYIPTNKTTSFKDRLNQYVLASHTSDLVDERANGPPPKPVSSALTRSSATLETDLQTTDESTKATASSNSRRRPLPKATTPTTSTSTNSSPLRMTRLRSSQSRSHAPAICPG